MKLIIITEEEIHPEEAHALNKLFLAGMNMLHLRKPKSSREELSFLIEQIAPEFHPRIVLHDHFSLLKEFALKGVHLNKRNPYFFPERPVHQSKSCHSLQEIKENERLDYVFLSPVFDSISKTGYERKYAPGELRKAKEEKIITPRVMALGGISTERIPRVAEWGFGGVAVLGGLWKDYFKNKDIQELIKRFTGYQTVCNRYI